MKLSTSLPYAGNIKQAMRQVQDLESAGLDIVWVAEAYGFDARQLHGLSRRADRDACEIGAGILPIYTRTPTLLAMTAAGIDALSDGRFILGLGASGPQVIEGFHGVPYDTPLARTREIIDICRQVWAARGAARPRRVPPTRCRCRPSRAPGSASRSRSSPTRCAAHIPIYVAVAGREERRARPPRSPTAGSRSSTSPSRPTPCSATSLAAGAAKRAADLGPLDIMAGGIVCDRRTGRDEGAARHVRPPDDGALRRRHGRQGPQLLQRRSSSATATRPRRPRSRTSTCPARRPRRPRPVPDELLELTNLCGSPGFVKERLAAYREAGVTIMNVTPIGPDPVKLVEQLKGWMA